MHNIVAAHKGIERAMWCLAEAAEQAAEAIAVFSLNGIILFVNTAWAAIHGYDTKRRLIGTHISIFHTQEQMKTDVFPFFEEVKRRGRLEGPLQHTRKDGSPLNTETKMTIVTDKSGEAIAVVAFAANITEKKQAQNELQEYCGQLERQIAELKTTNDKLQRQIIEREQAEEQLLIDV